jgi:hypothetical protein
MRLEKKRVVLFRENREVMYEDKFKYQYCKIDKFYFEFFKCNINLDKHVT